jgi:hypothetical protein
MSLDRQPTIRWLIPLENKLAGHDDDQKQEKFDQKHMLIDLFQRKKTFY